MQEYIEDFLDDVEASQAHGTWKTRRANLRPYSEWLEEHEVDVTEAEPKHIHKFLREEGKRLSDASVKSRYVSAKQLYDFLTGVWDVMEDSPMEDLELGDYSGNGKGKHQSDELVYVTPEEVEQLAEHASGPKLRNELLIRLLFQTGIRRCEVVQITLENLNRDGRAIEIWSPKTEDWRTVFYQPSLDTLLDLWIDGGYRNAYADSDYLFPPTEAEKLDKKMVNRAVKNAAENAGIQEVMYRDANGHPRRRITAHALRHGHAVEALKSGIDIRTVQLHMGHEELETTQRYLKLIDDDVEQAYARFGTRPDGAEA